MVRQHMDQCPERREVLGTIVPFVRAVGCLSTGRPVPHDGLMSYSIEQQQADVRRSAEGVSVIALMTAGLAVMFAMVALGFSVRRGNASTGPIASKAPVISEADVKLTDFKIVSSTNTFTAGPIKLKVQNKGASPHTLKIDGIGETKSLRPGQVELLDLGSLEAGTYTWYCTVAGHVDLNMIGKFTVVPKESGGPSAANVAAPSKAVSEPVTTVVDKDTGHQNVVKAFLSGPPAKTAGLGGQLLAPKLENGVKVFELETSVVQWEVAPGVSYEAWAYNKVVPGPQIRVKQGETVKVRLRNKLPESTSIHWHGVEISDNAQDGVTFVTQDPIKPGQTYEYTLTPVNCGSHMYHSHHAADAQVPLGLLGAFIVDCTTTPVPSFAAHDSESTQILSDGPLGFSMNGKGFPATAPIVAKVGERTLVRFMNEGLIIHPMHLHGHRMLVVGKDGNYLPAPYEADTLNIAPGERYDVIVTSIYPGAWAFHCHILTHAESDVGLHGMTTVWLVKP
jgi:manganese oxidase